MKRLSILRALLILGALPAAAQAGTILQAAGVGTNLTTHAGSPNNVINQSGLSTGYTSGLTDFDAYIAGSPAHNSNDVVHNAWETSNPPG